MEEKDIHAILALLVGLKDLAVAGAAIGADGKIDFTDLGPLMDLFAKNAELTAAIKDIKEIPAEITDLTQEESGQIHQAVWDIVNAVKAA